MIARLSDEHTLATTTFTVTFESLTEAYKPENRAPKFIVKPQKEYVRLKAGESEDEADKAIKQIKIGQIYDAEFDKVTIDLKCVSCIDQDFFTFNEDKKSIIIAPDIPIGLYKIEMTVSDDNIEGPKSTISQFSIFIVEEETPEVVKEFIKDILNEENEDETADS